MRKLSSILATALLCTAFSVAQGAPASPHTTKVGILNIQAAVVSTNEGKREIEALQKRFEPKQSELKNQSDEIEALKKQLAAQEGKLNDEARATLARNIDQKQKEFKRSLEDAQSDFQQAQNEILSRILSKLGPVVEKYAKQNGYTVVLEGGPQSPVLWAGEQVDITKDIVAAYDAESAVAAPTPNAPSAAKPPTTARRPAAKPQ